MDDSNNTLGRRDFIYVVGGALIAAELGVGCEGQDPAQGGAIPTLPAQPPAAPATTPTATPGAAGTPAAVPPVAQAAAAGSSSTPPQAQAPAAPVGAAGSGSPTAAATPPVQVTSPSSGAAGAPATGPTVTPVANGKGRVVIIKATDRVQGITDAIAMFGGLGFVAGRDVLLKPNYNSQYEFPATTHDDTLRTVVAQLKAANAGQITLGESSGATTGSSTPTATVMQAKNTLEFCKQLGIAFQSYDEPDVEWETFNFDGMTWSGGLAIPKLMRSDRVKILMPCCKTHTLADYTFSMKLAAGLPPRSRRGLISDMHTNLQEKVVDINMGFKPDLIVMDALKCFIDNGPDSGTVREPGLIVVATDRIALDAVGVAILKAAGSVSSPIRGKIFETKQIARAVKIGLTETKTPDDIELIGNDAATLMQLQSILDVG